MEETIFCWSCGKCENGKSMCDECVDKFDELSETDPEVMDEALGV